MKINQELFEKLESWRSQTNQRSVDIKADRGDITWRIWVYDYTIPSGMYVDEKTAHSDWTLEILRQNAQSKKAEAAQAEKRLGEYNDGISVG